MSIVHHQNWIGFKTTRRNDGTVSGFQSKAKPRLANIALGFIPASNVMHTMVCTKSLYMKILLQNYLNKHETLSPTECRNFIRNETTVQISIWMEMGLVQFITDMGNTSLDSSKQRCHIYQWWQRVHRTSDWGWKNHRTAWGLQQFVTGCKAWIESTLITEVFYSLILLPAKDDIPLCTACGGG